MAGPDGDVLPRSVGRYQLYGELAAGGMATVHFGRLRGPVGFSRTVAIKRLHPHLAKDPEFSAMFLDEARLCGRIRHPNVVTTLDVVATEGEIFIVMEYVPGEALSKLLKAAWSRGIVMPPRVVASILSSVLHGLHAAHVAKDEHGHHLGIVHRDVSPQNVLVGADGVARVLDFGVAKATGRLQTTRDGKVKGKIAYMPPEQLAGGQVSLQADVYAAAVVLWEALAGRRLFDGETEALVLVRAIEGRVDAPSVHNPALGQAIDDVVLRGLARDPALRYASARQFAVAIEQTIGIASPSEVGEWVEAIAHEDLARRAARVAEIESASLGFHPRIATAAPDRVEVPSQVSSISVSRPAMSAPPPARGPAARALVVALASIALAAVGVGAFATEDAWRGRALARRPPNLYGREQPRALSVRGSDIFSTKANASGPKATPAPTRRTHAPSTAARSPAAAPTPPPPVAPKDCDPPYTVDSTGHRKYKLECLD